MLKKVNMPEISRGYFGLQANFHTSFICFVYFILRKDFHLKVMSKVKKKHNVFIKTVKALPKLFYMKNLRFFTPYFTVILEVYNKRRSNLGSNKKSQILPDAMLREYEQ